MATITSTELGAVGRYIRFGDAALDDLGSQTHIAYCRPTASGEGGFGYLYGKNVSATDGPRFFVTHNAGSPYLNFSASSTTKAGFPAISNPVANSVTYGAWQHLEATWDGSILSNGIRTYVDGTLAIGANSTVNDGAGAVASDAAFDVYLMNRGDTARAFVGDFAYHAVWDRVLDSTERATVRADGPLAVPSGLVLLWANQDDLGPLALTASARSTYVAGAIPPNTALGGAGTPVAFVGTVPAQSWVEDSAITPLDLSTYFSGDITPIAYAVTTGTLPTGLSLNGSTGVISGTPTTPAAAVSIVVTATDADTNTAATNAFDITITSAVVVVKGVEVILHDRATLTPRASVTGITARWWDSPTAAGAPLLKTDAASTDGTGLLTIDIDAVTSLSVAALGYLVLYKAGAGADTDLHFAGRVAVSDIA